CRRKRRWSWSREPLWSLRRPRGWRTGNPATLLEAGRWRAKPGLYHVTAKYRSLELSIPTPLAGFRQHTASARLPDRFSDCTTQKQERTHEQNTKFFLQPPHPTSVSTTATLHPLAQPKVRDLTFNRVPFNSDFISNHLHHSHTST